MGVERKAPELLRMVKAAALKMRTSLAKLIASIEGIELPKQNKVEQNKVDEDSARFTVGKH